MAGYYQRCKLTIEIPRTGNYDKAAITKALSDKMPGVEITIRQSSGVPHVVEAFIPDNHPMAGMAEQEVGSTKMEPTGARTLLMLAREVLSSFKPS